MKNTIFIYLTDGFEEIEALATVDILRRADLDVKTVSITGNKQVTGAHAITVAADLLFEEVLIDMAQMLIIPGGTIKYNEHEGLRKQVKEFNEKGGLVSAICAAPAVLGGLGLLNGKRATCYPGFEAYLEGADLHTSENVVVDGTIVTGKGPGLSLEFALTLVEVLAGKEKRNQVASALLVK